MSSLMFFFQNLKIIRTRTCDLQACDEFLFGTPLPYRRCICQKANANLTRAELSSTR